MFQKILVVTNTSMSGAVMTQLSTWTLMSQDPLLQLTRAAGGASVVHPRSATKTAPTQTKRFVAILFPPSTRQTDLARVAAASARWRIDALPLPVRHEALVVYRGGAADTNPTARVFGESRAPVTQWLPSPPDRATGAQRCQPW